MRRATAGILIAFVALGLIACAPTLPPYSEVQAQANAAGEQLIELMPDVLKVAKRPEQDPYPCSGGGSYAATWDLHMGDNTDSATVVANLPKTLGHEWLKDVSTKQIGATNSLILGDAPNGITAHIAGGVNKDEQFIMITVNSACGER